MKKISEYVLAVGFVLLAGMTVSAVAQAGVHQTPCGLALSGEAVPGTRGLTLVDGGAIIYDANQGLCWLGDANLAGNPLVRASVKLSPTNPDGSTPVINPDGTMNYPTCAQLGQCTEHLQPRPRVVKPQQLAIADEPRLGQNLLLL